VSTVTLPAGAKEVKIEAIVLNADGSVKQNLGVVAYWHKNPLRRVWWHLTRRVKSWLPC